MKRSAGLLLWRRGTREIEVLLGHPGGPLFARKDTWTIPKGEYDDSEPALCAAHREFAEELGLAAPAGECVPLGEVTQNSGKRVTAWALEGDLDVSEVRNNCSGHPGRGGGRSSPSSTGRSGSAWRRQAASFSRRRRPSWSGSART